MGFNSIKVNNTDTNYTHSIFDISEYNYGAIYSNLSAALAAMPQEKQKGGMTVKFIQQITPAQYSVVKTENLETQPTGTLLSEAPYIESGTYDENQLITVFSTLPSKIGASHAVTYYVSVTVDEITTYTSWVITKVQNSDNKYAQYRLTKNTFSTTVTDWQGIDNVPKSASNNLIKSKGAILSEANVLADLGLVDFTLDADRAYYSNGGVAQYGTTNYYRTLPIRVNEGDVITYAADSAASTLVVAALDSNNNIVLENSIAGTTSSTAERTYTVPSGIKYLVFCNRYVNNPYVAKQGKYIGNVELGSEKIPNSDKVAKYVNGQNNYPGILPIEILNPNYCRIFKGYFGLDNNVLQLYFGDGRNHVVCRVTPGQTIKLTSSDSSHRVGVFLCSAYYNEDDKNISNINLTSADPKFYNINNTTLSFVVPSDTYFLAFNLVGNYSYPSKIVVNGNDVTDSFLKIISDYEIQNNKEWLEGYSINYQTGEIVSASNCSLSKFIPLQRNNCPAIIFTEFRNTGGYNYGFALYETTNEGSFIATTEVLYAQSQTTNGKVIIFIPADANYIRVTSHSTRNPNPHIEELDYAQSQMLAGGADEIPFTRGIFSSMGSSTVVGATWTPNADVNENTKLAIVNCHEGDVFTINGIGMTAKSYIVLDADNVILDVGGQLLKNHVITIPEGGVRLIISQRANIASSCYKGNATIGLMSFWQGTESEFDNLASYPEKRVFIDNESNILNIDHGSILTKEQKNFDKVDYSNDLVNYAHSEASYFQKGDWPRPLLITVAADRPMYSNAKFKLYDEDNNLVYEEIISTQTDKYVVKVWNLQPNITYHWELWNSNQTTRFSYGAITPQGYPRFVKVMEGANRVENVRDLGGWPVSWNKIVRYGLVFRGSDMNWAHTIDANGIAVMKNRLRIGCDVDLRSPSEYAPFLQESPLGSDVEWVNYPVTAYTIINGSGLSGTLYANAIKKIISNLSDGVVSYFHCKAGADRTGTLSLLILGILGVSESDLSKEYEFTGGRNRNTIDSVNNRDIPHLIATIKTFSGDTLQEKIISWALEYGVTQVEIDTLQEKMIIEKY